MANLMAHMDDVAKHWDTEPQGQGLGCWQALELTDTTNTEVNFAIEGEGRGIVQGIHIIN